MYISRQMRIQIQIIIKIRFQMAQLRPQSGAPTGLDPVKINQIFDKIFNSNNLEIEERNIKNLAQKVNLKLIDIGYLISNHSQQVGGLLQWLQNRGQALLQGLPGGGVGPPGTVCSMAAVSSLVAIFVKISQVMEGRALILQSGGKQLFNDLLNCLPEHEIQIVQSLQSLMSILVEGETGMPYATQSTPIAAGGGFQGPLADGRDLNEREESAYKQQQDLQSEATRGQQNQHSVSGFSRRDFSAMSIAQGQSPYQAPSQAQQSFVLNQSQLNGSAIKSQYGVNQTQMASSQMQNSNLQAMLLQHTSGVNQTHMEIMHKQQVLKEESELPLVVLSDQDEKEIFDLSVALKFGNPQTVFLSCQKLQYRYFQDFPPEVFLQRTDTIKALLDLLEGGGQAQGQNAGMTNGNEFDITSLAQQCLIAYVMRLRNLYRFLFNNGCKPSVMQKEYDVGETELTVGASKPPAAVRDDYIEKTYPCNRLSRWDSSPEGAQGGGRYGARAKSHGGFTKATGGQNSLSCKAVLGLILTKSIYLLQDTERIGAYTQLIQEALDALLFVFNVEGNSDFSEFLHLCLFAYDKVCDFYRDQLYEEALIQPVLTTMLNFVALLNTIPPPAPQNTNYLTEPSSNRTGSSSSTQTALVSRFKSPFTETLFKNTEHLQRALRRCLFRCHYSEDRDQGKYQSILRFFERLETAEVGDQTNLLQRDVQKSFFKAQTTFAKFVRVSDFRLRHEGEGNGGVPDEVCFVRTTDQLHEGLGILSDLSECIELKMDFPFEHLILDCIFFSGLAQDSQPLHGQEMTKDQEASRISELEKIVQTYLAIPIPEVRERILRRLYQKLRVGNAAGGGGVQAGERPKALNNNLYLAKFLLRKGILNHFVNGVLINRDIAANEESKLQMSLGQLIVKIIILAYNEIQGMGKPAHTSAFVQPLNQFLLSFQCLLPQYSDLISLIELIEEAGQKNCRYLRILRDLFSTQDHKREFATNVLRSSFSQDCQDEHIKDMLHTSIDLRQPSGRVAQNLELINSNYDFSSFGIQDITNILQSSQQDYGIKKSSLEQLTMVLFDVQNKRGRFLFSQSESSTDVFTYVLDEALAAQNSSKNFLKGRVSNLPKDQILFVNECLRFLFYSYIFFHDEPVVQGFFNKAKSLLSTKKAELDAQGNLKATKFEELLNALVYFMGCALLRENCLLLLYVQVYQQLWITTKTQKVQAPSGQLLRSLTVLIPDFCQESLFQLIPYTIQAIRMPGRDELILSDEQKMYVDYRCNLNMRRNEELSQLDQVSHKFCGSIASMRAQDYRQVLNTGVDLWKNYLLSIENLRDALVNHSTVSSLVELLKVLPTRDYEYYDLGDLLSGVTQILSLHPRLLGPSAEESSVANLEEMMARLMDALKYHLMPYLEETGVSGMDTSEQEVTPKSYLVHRYLELINTMIQADIAREKPQASILRDHLQRSSFLHYLISLFSFFKDSHVMRRLLISVLWQIILHYKPTDSQVLQDIGDLLVNLVSSTKMVFDQFEQSSNVMWCLRTLILLSQRRQLRVSSPESFEEEQLDAAAGLSQAYKSKLQKFKSFGWLLRFTGSRDARLRVLTWDLLTELFDYEFLRSHPSVIHQSISTYLKHLELYCVKIAALKFLNKVCGALMKNCEAEEEENRDLSVVGVSKADEVEQMTVQTLLQTLNRQGLISQIHKILSQRDCPLLFLTLTLQLLHNLTQMDYKKAIPVLTQLDYWTFLVELLDIPALTSIERQETRAILNELRSGGPAQEALVRTVDPCENLDLVYMSLNSILDFLFEAFKRDSQLAALLVKTTKLMQSVFFLLKHTLDQHRSDLAEGPAATSLRLRNKGLLTVFIDKVVKILHVAMLHPQDYSVDLIGKFLFEQPISASGLEKLPRNWLYFIDMFQIIERFNQTLGFTDIKLALIRFVSEFLIQTAHYSSNFLDELVTLQTGMVNEGPSAFYQADQSTYGSMLFIEFAKVFKNLYIDQRAPWSDASESENQKRDITLCLDILFSSCQSAKTLAVDQNFLKKVIDICQENASAIYLSELSKYSGGQKGQKQGQISQGRFEQQLLPRQFKYVADLSDIGQCEREAIRMLQLICNLFYDSAGLLVAFVSPSGDVGMLSKLEGQKSYLGNKKGSTAGKRDALLVSQSDKLINLFGQILEELGPQKSQEALLCECLMTMITYSSQNAKFKYCFMQGISVSTQSKKVSLLKLVCDKVVGHQSLQTNSRQLRLLFTLLRSLSLSADIVKEIMKFRFIEDITGRIAPQCKNDKDIKLQKFYLLNFMAFLSGFTSTDEGSRQILKIKQSFELALFLLDTVNIPAVPDSSIAQGDFHLSPINSLIYQILLFIRNATSDNRQNKVHFLKNDDFLPCLMAFLSQHNQHPKVKAQTAAVLWTLVHNHQGIKAAINRSSVISELQLMKSEYQREVEKEGFMGMVVDNDALEYHANYTLADSSKKQEQRKLMVKDMNEFMLKALTGILVLVQA